MSEVAKATPGLGADDLDQLVVYRAISPLAVAAMLLGVASALALAHPGLWIVPAVAVCLAAWSLRVIALKNTELVGRTAALIGLGLAILFGVWAPARLVSRQAWLYLEARAKADEWLSLLREGRLYEAYELHLNPAERQPADASLAEYYGDLSQPASGPRTDRSGEVASGAANSPRLRPQHAIRDFYAGAAMQALVSAAASGELVFLGLEAVESRPGSAAEDIILRFEIRRNEGRMPHVRPLTLTLTRARVARSGMANWTVASVAEPVTQP